MQQIISGRETIATITTDMSDWNENQLDDAAFEILFKKYFVSLCAWCQYKFRFELDTAKEAVHSGFIKLWENRRGLSPGISVKAYLYKIITNICLDMLRHEKVKQQHQRLFTKNLSGSSIRDDTVSADLKQLSFDIDRAISELPEQMRRVFELSRNEGLKYSEIAAQLHISIKTVETQMSRALVKLREKLVRYLPLIIILLFSGL